MAHHVWAWVAGFGWTIMPRAPYQFEAVPGEPRSVLVAHTSPRQTESIRLTVSEDGDSIHTTPSPPVGSLVDVVDLIRGAAYPEWDQLAAHDSWRIETSLYHTCWPSGFTIRSVANAPPPFELVGPDHCLIWIQGPFDPQQVPPPDRMNGPGQTIDSIAETEAGPLVELRYQHSGEPWVMFHAFVERFPGAVCLVSAQAPAHRRDLIRNAAEELAISLTPFPQS